MTDQDSINVLNSLVPPIIKISESNGSKETTSVSSPRKVNADSCPHSATSKKPPVSFKTTDLNGHENGDSHSTGNGGGCPFLMGQMKSSSKAERNSLRNPEWQTSKSVTSESILYEDYLYLDKVLTAQHPISMKYGKLAHDEHLFIVTHQAYELWFKQIIFELDSIMDLLNTPVVDDRCILVVVQRVQRINLIWKLLTDQITILETMAPTDFLDFRGYLTTASGFQSLQFRIFENKLGLSEGLRFRFNQKPYDYVFTDTESRERLRKSEEGPTLLKLIEAWLERTPGLVTFDFTENGNKVEYNFLLKEYEKGVQRYLTDTFIKPAEEETDEFEKESLLDEYKKNWESFQTIFDQDKHNKLVERGERKLSHKALWGALMIWLNRDEPRFHLPYQFLLLLTDLDALINRWRYNHAHLAQRQVGNKTGTGGSSGYSYLRSTASDRYKLFNDIVNLSSWLIPKEYVPKLTDDIRKRLNDWTNERAAAAAAAASAAEASRETTPFN